MKWVYFGDKLPPRDAPVLVTDGENVWCAVLDHSLLKDWGHQDNICWYPHCVSGHEWEWDVSYRDVNFWAELPSPP